jgi:hypothetical protein
MGALKQWNAAEQALLTSLSPEEYERAPTLSREQIREALDRGRRDMERAYGWRRTR